MPPRRTGSRSGILSFGQKGYSGFSNAGEQSPAMGGVFTESATRAIRRANDDAARMNHSYVATEHLLLGLLEDDLAVAEVLNKHGIAPDEIRRQVALVVQPGKELSPSGRLPLTPRAKIAIEFALEEHRLLKGDSVGVGPESILLGLLREREGVAAQLLWNLGLRLETVREQLKQL